MPNNTEESISNLNDYITKLSDEKLELIASSVIDLVMQHFTEHNIEYCASWNVTVKFNGFNAQNVSLRTLILEFVDGVIHHNRKQWRKNEILSFVKNIATLQEQCGQLKKELDSLKSSPKTIGDE